MSRYYNEFYSYDDIGLWNPEVWYERGGKADPVILKAVELAGKRPAKEYFSDRHDEVRDAVNRCAYFTDVVESWRKTGLQFSCAGMMGLTMVPVSTAERRNLDPRVLYVPVSADFSKPHWAMNVLESYRDLLERCAEEEILVQFLTIPRDKFTPMVELGLETQGTYKVSYREVYLDISALKENGVSLDEIDGVSASDFGEEQELLGLAVLDVSDKWQSNQAHQVIISQMYLKNQPEWNYEKHIHSAMGRLQAESFHLEGDYRKPDDPELHRRLDKLGLKYEDHFYGRDWWVTLTPKSVSTKPDKKIPLLCVMKEPRTAVPQALLTGMQFYYNFIDIAAHGEFMMLFFVLETADDNDILADIISEAEKLYPIDPTRIYITGQSHNGYYALEFYRRHPELIAAAATLCDPIGLQVGATIDFYDTRPDEIVSSFSEHDMPLININGQLENKFYTAERGSELEKKNAEYFRRRLKAFRCRERSIEEIIAARDSDDYATRINGVPSDRTEVRYIMGSECYISDLQNVDGNWHLRFATLENLPHMIAPQMAELAWSFIRRFARDRDTGRTIELY